MNRAVFLLVAAYSIVVPPSPVRSDEVCIVVEGLLPPASVRALSELREALTARGDKTTDARRRLDQAGAKIIVGLAGTDAVVDEALAAADRKLPQADEAAAIVEVPAAAKTIVITGSDDRGLTYALRDAARGIAVLPKDKPWHEGLTPTVEQPFLKVRNVSVHLFNADCEREWFFSEEFWRFYFQRLSLSRFNRCTLTFCDQTNYLCPPYAYLVEMPEYPGVKVADCTPQQRKQNLAMVRRIAELADEYAVDFDLGIWMQAPVAKWAAPVQVSGLPEGLKLAEYCALGLRRILEACPSIDGLQLRMNAEAGVPEDQQTAFYKPMFQAMATFQSTHRNGRPLRLDLRYKGLTDETINAALAEQLDVTVSTKFWSEHLGMPYHPTTVDSHYAKDRYSFGTLLKKPRRYQVTYQLWNVGSNRLTLWGDPAYAAQFAKSCTLSGGEGFEVFAPLTNKGYGNKPGAWQVIKNSDYRVGKWEQERYWMFYLCFGRMGYNPATNPETWKREFRHRFGDAAEPIEQAYAAASQVLPLITTALLPSASEWYWWPEMDTGGKLREYSRIQTSDPGMFAAIRSWERTPEWRWEEWDNRPGFIEDVLAGKKSDRRTPHAVSWLLHIRAQEIDRLLRKAASIQPLTSAEQKMTGADLKLLAGLAKYHGSKYQAALNYSVFETSGISAFQHNASLSMREASEGWKQIVSATDGIYHDDLVFGITPDSPRSKFGHHHSGHWRDRLVEIESDAAKLQELTPNARLKSTHVAEAQFGEPSFTSSAKQLRSHIPAKSFDPRSFLTIHVGINYATDMGGGRQEPQRVFAYVRPLDQTRTWTELEMAKETEQDGNKTWAVNVLPNILDPAFDLQYYFVFHYENSKPLQWTFSQNGAPYYVVPVETK